MCVNILIWGCAFWLLVNSHNSVFIMKISKITRWLLLKEINPEYSLEGLMLTLKLQYFSHLMRRADALGKTLMLAKIEDKRRRAQQRMRWLDSFTDSMDMNLSREIVDRGN